MAAPSDIPRRYIAVMGFDNTYYIWDIKHLVYVRDAMGHYVTRKNTYAAEEHCKLLDLEGYVNGA